MLDTQLHTPLFEAEYRDEEIKAFQGNPFIEGIPTLPSDEELEKMLRFEPEFDASERTLSAQYRIQRLDSLLEMVVPLPRTIALARSMLKLMRTGYARRKPLSKADINIKRALYQASLRGCFQQMPRRERCLQHSVGLSGASGSGKSFILRRVAELLPEALTHKESGRLQLPFLFIEMSPDGASVHTIADQLFFELDRLLPNEDFSYRYRGGNGAQRLVAAFNIAYRLGTGLIVIDEKQNQNSIGKDPERKRRRDADKRPKDETSLSKHLVMASNISNIPLVMAGTLETLHMLGARLTGGRRVSGRGSATWLPLEATFSLQIPDEFEQLMQALWKYQWTDSTVRIGRGWLAQFYRLSQGVPDVMVKLYMAAQERAILHRCPTITKEIVEDAYRLEFVHADFALDGMRRRDRSRLPLLTDFYHPGVSPAKAPVLPDEDHGTETAAAPDASSKAQSSNRTPPAAGDKSAVTTPARHPSRRLQLGSAEPTPHVLSAELLSGVDLRDAIDYGQAPVGLPDKGD